MKNLPGDVRPTRDVRIVPGGDAKAMAPRGQDFAAVLVAVLENAGEEIALVSAWPARYLNGNPFRGALMTPMKLTAVACAVTLLSSGIAAAADVSIGFGGVIDFNGAFPPAPNPVGQPVDGSVKFASPLVPTSTTPTTTNYLDPAGDLKLNFGAGGIFASFDANSPLLISVSDIGGNTALRFEAWNGGALGVGDKGVVSFTAPGLNAFGPARALPSSPFTFSQLLAGSPGIGGITISGGLTSFNVTSVTPEPTTAAAGVAGIAALMRRRRR